MKISYISDLHLDFWIPFTHSQTKWKKRTEEFIVNLIKTDKGGSDILCLAGDYSHYNSQSFWAISKFAEHYKQVIVQYGNHDMYLISKNQSKRYGHSSMFRVKQLKDSIKNIENVQPLFFGETYTYKGIRFGGCPMFYPLETIEQQMFFNNISNDSKYIKGVDIKELYLENQQQYERLLEKNIDVMISHVPIIPIKSHEKYGNTHCYYTPVHALPPYIIMGHSHEKQVYEKSGSYLFMNCIGYPQDQLGEPNLKNFEVGRGIV